MKFIAVFFGLLAAGHLAALEIGEDAPPLEVGKWLMNGPVKVQFTPDDPKDARRLYVYVFWGTWSMPSREVVPLLALLQKKYQNESLQIILISREEEAVLTSYLEKNSIGGCAMLLDGKSASTLAYMGNDRMFPKAYAVGSGMKIIWSGEPADLPEFLDRFYSGNFNLSKEKERGSITLELKIALQQQTPELIRRLSDDLLKLYPEDGFALRTRLFICETEGNFAEAIQLLDRMISTHPSPKLFFIKLDFIARYPEFSDKLVATAQLCLEKFGNSGETMNNLAWLLLERFPYFPGTLEIANAAAERAEKLSQEQRNLTQFAAACNTRALVLYKSGLIPQAIAYQQRALEACSDNPAATKSGTISLDYYQRALKLRDSSTPPSPPPLP